MRGRAGCRSLCLSGHGAETSNRILGQFLRTRLGGEVLQRPESRLDSRVKGCGLLVAGDPCLGCRRLFCEEQAQTVVKDEFSLLPVE